MNLHLGDSLLSDTIQPLHQVLESGPYGERLRGFVGQADANVFGPAQPQPLRYLLMDNSYYLDISNTILVGFEVGSYVAISKVKGNEVEQQPDHLVANSAPYSMARFSLKALFDLTADGSQAYRAPQSGKGGSPFISNWRRFDSGVEVAEVGRSGRARIVVYDIPANAPDTAFGGHLHRAGEVFVVVRGEVYDEFGTYHKGEMVTVGPNTVHTPRTRGHTILVVTWPDGITPLPT